MNEASIKKEIKEFKEEVDQLEEIEEAMGILFAWHSNKVASLEHMLSMPKGVEVTVNDGAPIMMTDEIHKGFIIGLTVALIELGTLPFATPDDYQSDEDILH